MLNSVITESITLQSFLICIFSSLALGVLTALVFTAHGHHTGSLTLSLAMLPPVEAEAFEQQQEQRDYHKEQPRNGNVAHAAGKAERDGEEQPRYLLCAAGYAA